MDIKKMKLKAWFWLIPAALCICLCVIGLRSNYSRMVKLRTAVYAADQNDNGIVEALQNLQAFVTHHMNTNLATANGVYPPIQLKYTYDRLVQEESQKLTDESSQNATLYTQAQTYCQALYPYGYVINKIPCIDNYIETHGVSSSLSLQQIPASLYEFDFASPTWSPDLAGWSMVAGVIFVIGFVVAFIKGLLNKKR